MLTVLSPTSSSSDLPYNSNVPLDELSCVADALEPLKQMIVGSGRSSVRLHCTIPTLCSASGHCVDLHDLHELRSRALLFLHDLLETLRCAGVQATYQLAPSNSDLVIVRVLSPAASISLASSKLDVQEKIRSHGKNKALLAVVEEGPVMLIT